MGKAGKASTRHHGEINTASWRYDRRANINMQFHCIYQHISNQIIASRYMSYTMVLIMRLTRVREH